MNVSELQKLIIKELTELATKLEIESYSGMNEARAYRKDT